MKTKSIRKTLLPVLSALMILLVATVLLCRADATEDKKVYGVSHTNSGDTSYYSIEDAWEASKGVAGVYMTCDWCLNDMDDLELEDDGSSTIYMNGYKIYRTEDDDRIFYIGDGAELYLNGRNRYGNSRSTEVFTFNYYDRNCDKKQATVQNVGGLVCGGYTNNSGGGIYMGEGARLELKHVAVAGNYAGSYGGGVYMENSADEDDMRYDLSVIDGALICYNYAKECGGGVYADGGLTSDNTMGMYLFLSDGHIDNNFASSLGGGIAAVHNDTHIKLTTGSTISNNRVDGDGGGVYFEGYYHEISGGTMSGNSCETDGGAIYASTIWGNTLTIDGTTFSSNKSDSGDGGAICTSIDKSILTDCVFSENTAYDEGGAIYMAGEVSEITSCTFTNNKTSDDGGAIYVYDDYLSIQNSSFTGNTAGEDGGAIYVNDDDCTIDGSEFSGNAAGENGGAIYVNDDDCTIGNTYITGNRVTTGGGEGGGVYLDDYDLKLFGYVIIKNNYRATNTSNVDDLFIEDGAYIVSRPINGSEIGIRTDASDEDRQVGEDADFTYSEKYFFSDRPGYYMNATSSNELWLRRRDNCSYAVYVNGKLQGYYNDKAVVGIDGTPTDSSKVFKYWEEENGHVNVLNMWTSSSAQTVKDHRFELRFNAVYATKISDVTLTVAKPVAGENLAETGTLSWTDTNGNKQSREVGVYWLTQNGGLTQTVSGKADYATNYSVAAKIGKNVQNDLVFADKVTGKVVYGTGAAQEPVKIYVDANGALYVYGNQVMTDKAVITSVMDANISIAKDSTIEALKNELPTTATVYDAQGNRYTVYLDSSKADFSGIEDPNDKTKVNNDGGTVTMPLILYNLEKLENTNDMELTVSVTVSSLGVLAAPTASPESETTHDKRDADGRVTLSIALSTEETTGTKISYRCYELGAEGGEFIDYSAPISISANKGEKKIYIIEAKTVNLSAGKDDSTVATFTYTLDNPYTVTVSKTVKVSDESEYSLGTYVAKYYADDTVIIGAPVVDGYVFSKWDSARGLNADVEYAATDDAIKAGAIANDITVTALYTPVLSVDSLNITLTAPVANDSLATRVSKVTATVSGLDSDGTTQSKTMDMTKYLENVTVTWSPDTEHGRAAYSTVYTAKITLPEDTTTVKFTSLGAIVVNENITATVKEEDGKYVVYVTFPRTEDEPLKQPTFTAPTAKTGLTYTGNDQELINAGSATGGTMVYFLEGDDDFSAKIPTGNAAGEYTVYYMVRGNEGYEDTEPQSLTVVIAETVTPSPEPSESPEPTASPEPSTRPTPTTPVTPTPSTSPTPTTPVTPEPTTPVTPEPTKPVTPDDGKCKQDSTCPIAKFSDSDPKAWYHDGVHYCLVEGLMKGVSDSEFAPNANMTRAQLVTILWRMNGEKAVNYAMTFKDVSSDSWYTEAVRWAASEGIVEGYSAEKFGPNDAVTREQMATILWRYAKYKGMDVSVGEDTNIMDYDDVKDISSYAVSAMQWAVGEGIIKGTDNVTLAPKGTATRAQVAVMIERFDR